MNDQYLEFAKHLAYDAGDVMLKYFTTKMDNELKADDTIVTVADKEINSLVIERIKLTYGDHAVIGEEESHANDTKHAWVCDPIDGTNPFAMSLAVSVFSLAYVYDGEPLVGVIYDPFVKRLFWASKGKGAFVNDEPLAVSTDTFGPGKRMNFDWWANAEFDILPKIRQLSLDTGTYMLSPGSTTHMAALVAQGDFLGSVFCGTKEKCMDIAAAKVIVEEAGGKVTDMFGNDQRYDGDINGAIVSNGVVHEQLVNLMKETKYEI
jgi:myo-inositol-1(or 4)-monophosphatase